MPLDFQMHKVVSNIQTLEKKCIHADLFQVTDDRCIHGECSKEKIINVNFRITAFLLKS